jgi:hypothetical protein
MTELRQSNDQAVLTIIDEEINRLHALGINDSLKIPALAIKCGVIISNSELTSYGLKSKPLDHQLEVKKRSANRAIIAELQDLITEEKANVRALNDLRATWTEGVEAGELERQLLNRFSEGRQLSVQDYKKFIDVIGERVGCSVSPDLPIACRDSNLRTLRANHAHLFASVPGARIGWRTSSGPTSLPHGASRASR